MSFIILNVIYLKWNVALCIGRNTRQTSILILSKRLHQQMPIVASKIVEHHRNDEWIFFLLAWFLKLVIQVAVTVCGAAILSRQVVMISNSFHRRQRLVADMTLICSAEINPVLSCHVHRLWSLQNIFNLVFYLKQCFEECIHHIVTTIYNRRLVEIWIVADSHQTESRWFMMLICFRVWLTLILAWLDLASAAFKVTVNHKWHL